MARATVTTSTSAGGTGAARPSTPAWTRRWVCRVSASVSVASVACVVVAWVCGGSAAVARHAAALGALQLCAVLVFTGAAPGRVRQPQQYHAFADRRRLHLPLLCGGGGGGGGGSIPNASDVWSNVPFAVFGAEGLAVLRFAPLAWVHASEQVAWAVFFASAMLIAVGSAYYHWQPDDARLVWDRVPMAAAFMALLTCGLCERTPLAHSSEAAVVLLLALLVVAGVASVLHWRATDDLRWYLVTQFYAIVVLLQMLLVLPSRYTHAYLTAVALALYLAAKLAELNDRRIFVLTRKTISGHTLKHLLAALAIKVLADHVRLRGVLVDQRA